MSEIPANGLSIAGPAFQIYMMCATQSDVTLAGEFAELFAGFSICRKKGGAPVRNPQSKTSSPAVVREDSQRGAALLEYALVVALIAVVGISGVRTVGIKVTERLFATRDALAPASGSLPDGDDCPPMQTCN